MIFRLYHETAGGHVHCRLFAGKHEGALGKCGDFVMRTEEFERFSKRSPAIEFKPPIQTDLVLVPIEPTPEMLESALVDYLAYERQGPSNRPWNGRTMWGAMLSRRPV